MLESQVTYHVSLDSRAQHLLNISLTIKKPLASQQLVMPNWVPGSYMIRDFAKNIVTLKASANSQPVVANKLSKSSWQLEFLGNQAVDEVLVEYNVYCYDLSPRGAFVDLTRAFFDGCHVFLEVIGKNQSSLALTLHMPENWQCMTSMPTNLHTSSTPMLHHFVAPNYLNLIDHPVTMGKPEVLEFSVANTLHQIAITGVIPTNVDFVRLVADIKSICDTHVYFFGELPAMPKYLFILHVSDSGYGGIEHNDCSSMLCSRDALPLQIDKLRSDNYTVLLGLFSHEYFHLWNVKRIKPAAFNVPNLQAEVYTKQLWIFEGITSYYDDLAVLKAKCISIEQYLSLIAKTLNRIIESPGARVQNLEESSFDAWCKFYKKDENAINSIVSYYAKGSLVALCLDILIIQKTNGKHSLQNLMQTLWLEYGKKNIGLPEYVFEKIASELVACDLSEFFNLTLRTTKLLPLDYYLNLIGVATKPIQNTIFEELGIKLKADTNRIYATVNGKHAVASGLNPGDEIIAIDNIKVSRNNFEQRINNCPIDSQVNLQIFRDKVLITVSLTIPNPQYERLEFMYTANSQNIIQQKWLT